MMTILKIAFEFLMGLICVLMALMAATMVTYILKVTLEEIFGGDPFVKIKGWFDEAICDFRDKKGR